MRALLIAALLLALAAPAGAQEVRFSADSMLREGTVYTLEGSVRVERLDAVITADRAVYDEATGLVRAEGDVFYEDPDVTLSAERADVNLSEQTGVLHKASLFVKAEGFRIQGDEVERVSEDRFLLKGVEATTCEGPSPAWCLRGSEADVLLGERLKVKHATFRVKGVPVIYTPYIWAPIITERRSGLLPPTVGYRDSTGFLYRQPYFWAMSENRDATIFLDFYSKSAFGQGLEYRYIEAPGVTGNQSLYHIRDSRTNRDYYEARGEHRLEGQRASGFVELNIVNYREFYRRYEPFLEMSSLRYLESRAEASARMGTSRAYLLGQFFQDLKEGTDRDNVLHRLPEAGFFLAPLNVGPVALRGTATASNFTRKEGPEGQRYDMSLRGTYTVGRGPTLTQEAGLRETVYDLGDSAYEDESTELYDYVAVLQVRLARDYGAMSHEVVPAVSYSYVERDGEEPPLLDVLETEEEASVAELSVTNRLTDGEGEMMVLKVAQPYDFKGGDRPLRPLLVNLTLQRPLTVRTTFDYDLHRGHVNTANSDISFGRKSFTVSAGQRYQREADFMFYTLEAEYRATSRLSLGGHVWYDADGGGTRELAATVNYRSQCWGISVSGVKRPDDYGVFFKISLLGLGEFGA